MFIYTYDAALESNGRGDAVEDSHGAAATRVTGWKELLLGGLAGD